MKIAESTFKDKIILGAAQFGMHYGFTNKKRPEEKEVSSIIDICKEHNIKSFDTSPAYGNSEKILGKYIDNTFEVTTKLPVIPKLGHNEIKKWTIKSIESSLKSLKIDRIENILFHQEYEEEFSPVTEELLKLKEEGKINNIGVSTYQPQSVEKLCKQPFKTFQIPANIVDQRSTKLNIDKVELQARSIFLQGLILENKISDKFMKWEGLWRRIDEFCERNSLDRVSLCLNYIYHQNNISKVVIGVNSQKHLLEILNSTLIKDFPCSADLSSEDENLVNPSKW